MNKQEADMLIELAQSHCGSQRELAESSGHSLGIVNRSVRALKEEGLLDDSLWPTEKARELLKSESPRRAVILAAGYGMRMVPINTEMPKALLEIHGEPLIERQIRQLQEAGVSDIRVIVGFMKEQLEYLIDQYDVKLIVNSEYSTKNNLHSLALAAGKLENCYVVPCDIWSEDNPFSRNELYSWYMVGKEKNLDSSVRLNRKKELVRVREEEDGNRMIGISYLNAEDGRAIGQRLKALDRDKKYDGCFWEEALYSGDRMMVSARLAEAGAVQEINTYEQLREIDSGSNHLKTHAIEAIMEALQVRQDEICNIAVLKKGMTNRSFLFQAKGKKYIMRIPGEGTDQLINRQEEAAVFRAISGLGLCDDPVYINPENGYKITKFLEGIRVADPEDPEDLERCMKKLREFHEMKLTVGHSFDIFKQIEFYESLWEGKPSVYKDYPTTKERVLSLRRFIDEQPKDWSLTHIDAVPDNFLFYTALDGSEQLQLTDWEYAGMQDPHVDIAMFSIYSLYDKAQIDRLIDLYFEGRCDRLTRAKIYCYVAACGLLWSNWCEFKRNLGVEFGEYSLRQYRYAKDYYRYAIKEIEG